MTTQKILLQVYRGYVDDPRNTDNSWMETIAYHFHDEDGTSVGQFNLHAGKYSELQDLFDSILLLVFSAHSKI